MKLDLTGERFGRLIILMQCRQQKHMIARRNYTSENMRDLTSDMIKSIPYDQNEILSFQETR